MAFMQDDFLGQITGIIEQNIDDEQFGVSELAEAVNMSRSNLLRKIKKQTNLSASQFIRQVRLEIAMEMLKEGGLTVSEVSYKVGFGSTSYFIKCFREQYGYPPGEVCKKVDESSTQISSTGEFEVRKLDSRWVLAAVVGLIVISIGSFIWFNTSVDETPLDKSIAVLPFKNESSDSSNEYFINGLMESTLNNLQKIEELRVISRTSVEKYRNTTQSIPEIAGELGVSYFVEGSGQKVGDQVLLHIQLIDASTDEHIWGEQYSSELADVFTLQNEIATKITDAIQVIVTPAELEQIDKIPTTSLEAYDYYLQAMEHFFYRSNQELLVSIPLFEKAIELDPEFSLAYAHLAMSYYFLEIFQAEKQYTEQINNYADKALLFDSRSAESLLAKAFYYMHTLEYRLAVPYLEKALEYNPNSSAVIQTLSDLYARIFPNTSKYLEYALRGVQLDVAASDSIQRSYLYLHLSNAFIQTGFVDESIEYINLSIEYNPANEFSPYLKPLIEYAEHKDLNQTIQGLVHEFNKDTTRIDIMQELGKAYYFDQRYDSAHYYYQKFVNARELYGLEIFPNEDAKIAYVLENMGKPEEASLFYESYAQFCEADQSIYQSIHLAMKYAIDGDIEKGIEQLKVFAEQDNVQYWVILFLEDDPLIHPLMQHPDYEQNIQKIKDRFWETHNRLKTDLEEKGLI